MPPIKPSIVLLGLSSGRNEFFPKFFPMIYAPVCCNKGTDDEKEYNSVCEARCELLGDGQFGSLLQCEPGKCENDPGCACTLEWAPVCCSGSKTFGNQCQAQCDGYDESQCTCGSCQDITICTMEYMPLCCNKKTYSNPC